MHQPTFDDGSRAIAGKPIRARRRLPPRSLRRWAAGLIVMMLSACGGGGGAPDAPVVDPGPGPDPGPSTFALVPARLGLALGGDGSVLAVQPPGALTWSSSNPAVVSVDAQGRVTALAEGSAVVTATAGTASSASSVRVYAAAAPTGSALIATALSQGRISAEQSLMYQVFAVFGDERLPPEFDGAPDPAPNHLLLRQLMTTIGSLSPSAQDVLRPFLVPPIYADSWFAQRVGLTAVPAPARTSAQAAVAPRQRALAATNCSVAITPSLYARVSTAHFNVYYTVFGGTALADENTRSAAMAATIASLVEEVYAADTQLIDPLDRLDDSGEACDGGDNKYDIYLGPYALGGLAAWTTAYPLPPLVGGGNACARRPSHMMLNSQSAEFAAAAAQPANARPMVKSILAHEFLHALQLSMDRAASCADTEWFDEATAQWVMDHVVPTIAQGLPGEFGMEPGIGNVASNYAKSGPVLAEYLYSGHLVSIEKSGTNPKLNGYSDYLFFQFIARTKGPAAIKQIFDAMAGGRNSVEAVAAAVDMKTVWPEFAKTLWIGWEDKVLDYWATEDEYRFGLAQVYAQVPTQLNVPQDVKNRQKSLPIDQKGGKTAQFELLAAALTFGGDYEIEPRSVLYEHLKFNDATVHTAVFYNPIANRDDNGFMKLQALRKIGGKWQAPEDWTNDAFKTWCLDKQDERLEELLLIVSNSQADRSVEQPFVIGNKSPMKLATSNVGCWRWFGTSSLTTQWVTGETTVESMTGQFFRYRELLDPALRSVGLIGLDAFIADQPSQIAFSISGRLDASGCTISGSGTALQQAIGEGSLFINYLTLDGPPSPLDRMVVGSGTTTVPAVTETIACAGGVEKVTLDIAANWLSLPPEGVRISADGQTISGSWVRTDSGGTKTSAWIFTSVRD